MTSGVCAGGVVTDHTACPLYHLARLCIQPPLCGAVLLQVCDTRLRSAAAAAAAATAASQAMPATVPEEVTSLDVEGGSMDGMLGFNNSAGGSGAWGELGQHGSA